MHETSDCWSRDMFNTDLIKKGLGLVYPHILCIIFQKFWCYLPLIDQISLSHCLWLLSSLWHYKGIILHDQKFVTKIEISQAGKEHLRWNQKHFSSFLNEFKLPEIVQDLRVYL